MTRKFLSLSVFLCATLAGITWVACAGVDEEGLSRTSWGRFGWWETHIQAANRTNIDGLLAYNVTLDGLAGAIACRQGDVWNIAFSVTGSERAIITLSRQWFFSTDPDDLGMKQGWHRAEFDHSKWRTMMVGPLADAEAEAASGFDEEKTLGWGMSGGKGGGPSGAWENQGLPDYDGVAWYRLEATIPAEWKAEKILYHCYGIDDEDTTFVNGVKVGETTMKENPTAYIAERTYEIPADVIKWGEKNCFAVRVFDDHGDGGFTGTAPEIVRGAAALEAQSVKPQKAGEAPQYIKKFNWVTKWIELPDYKMTYSLASALVRVRPKGKSLQLTFDAPVEHAAYVTGDGARVVSPREGVLYDYDLYDTGRDAPLTENWVLLWHGGSAQYNEDLPMLMVLHGRPERITCAGKSVTLHAQGENSSFDFGPPFGLRRFKGADTEKWTAGLPEEVVAACRFWSRATLAYPVGNKELYSVDQDSETVTITEEYEYETVHDDWGTEPLKIAAVPPILTCMLDAGYPGKMLSKRTDPGFVTYYGPFAATVDSDSAKFVLPIPVEDGFAALEAPGRKGELDELSRGVTDYYQKSGGRDWSRMGLDDGAEVETPISEEVMSFDDARERAFLGTYPVTGIPADHKPGAPLPRPEMHPFAVLPVPSLLAVDGRVRPGIIAIVRRMNNMVTRNLAGDWFLTSGWRVEVEPTSGKPMTYHAFYRYGDIPDRFNGEAPYDFASVSAGVVFGVYETTLWTGNWNAVRNTWHRILQLCDPYWRNHDWASAACDEKDSWPINSVDCAWDHTGGIDALAGLAYGVGDMKTYDFLCYVRARLAMINVGMEAIQQYLQPVLSWPDHYFVGGVGEPRPPSWQGIVLSYGGAAAEWGEPYPEGAINQISWRFNNANPAYGPGGLRWMAMTQPKQARWVLARTDEYLPHAFDGERDERYAPEGKAEPPYFPDPRWNICVNLTTLSHFVGDPVEKVENRLDRLGRIPALAPWDTEATTVGKGRGVIQQLLACEKCPMWASAWEPRVIWDGRYDPATGKATIVVQPGDAPLRFKGTSRQSPLGVAINGEKLSKRGTLKDTRATGGWCYDPARQTIHVYSNETGKLTLEISFQADPDVPALGERMVPEKPVEQVGVNLLVNASFDQHLTNGRRSPFVGAPTGPYLYVNRWLAPGLPHTGGAFKTRYLQAVGKPCRTPGLALQIHAVKECALVQNVPASPGTYRLTAFLQLGERPWDPAKSRLTVTLKALQVAAAINELQAQSRIITPGELTAGSWMPVVLEVKAPQMSNAVQVGLSLEPLSGPGDVGRTQPVYVDDVELCRVVAAVP